MGKELLRAVIYCRCSTEEESQREALISQVEEAKECVRQQGWLLVDTFVESKSGTSTSKRTEYNRLYEALLLNHFDIVVIKSQDRLNRNTKDWYLFIDRLVTSQKKLYMYIDRKFYSPDEALITGIKAILAEEYSRELSKKILNAHHNRQIHNGNIVMNSNAYGWKRLPDKSFVLVEEEAQVKRKMYELCAAGYGSNAIAAILEKEGIRNRDGNPFHPGNIRRIIRNPINMGTAVMNRFHYDFDSKRTIRVPESEWYVYKDKVPAIVSEELWQAANEAMKGRSRHIQGRIVGRYRGKSQLSGKLICGLCGEKYYHTSRKSYKDGSRIYEWCCHRYMVFGTSDEKRALPQNKKVQYDGILDGCSNVHLNEDTLYELLETVVNKYYRSDREKIVHNMMHLLKQVLQEKDVQPDIKREEHKQEKILKQMDMLLEKLLNGVLGDDMYQRKHKELEKSLEETRTQLKLLEEQKKKGSVLTERIAYIEEILKKENVVEKATVAQMLEDIEKIIIYPTYMEIVYNLPDIMKVGSLALPADMVSEYPCEPLQIDYGNMFNYREKKVEEREIIVDIMRENPHVKAKDIAEQIGMTLSGVNYRIKRLKDAGRIRNSSRNGRGVWIVCDNENVV